MNTFFVALLAVIAGAFVARTARACGPCSAGDPAITFGVYDRPVEGRLRLGASLRRSNFGVRGIEVAEHRYALSASYSPDERFSILGSLPFSRKFVSYRSLAREETMGLADAEVALRFVAFRDRSFAPEHVLAVQVQLALPTSTPLVRGNGVLLPIEAQPGRGAFEPSLWAFWTYHGDPVGTLVSASVAVPFEGIDGEHAGVAFRGSAMLRVQAFDALSFFLGLESKYETIAQQHGVDDPDSPLFALGSALSVALRAPSNVVWVLTERNPLFQVQRGSFYEGHSLELMVYVDV